MIVLRHYRKVLNDKRSVINPKITGKQQQNACHGSAGLSPAPLQQISKGNRNDKSPSRCHYVHFVNAKTQYYIKECIKSYPRKQHQEEPITYATHDTGKEKQNDNGFYYII